MRTTGALLLFAMMAVGCSRGWDDFETATDAGGGGSAAGGTGGSAGSSTGGAPSGGTGGGTGGSPQSCNTCTPAPCECAPTVSPPWSPARFAELLNPNAEPACPAGWTAVGLAGAGLKDTGCSDCECAPKDTGCVTEVTWYTNADCTAQAWVSTTTGDCATPPAGVTPGSFKLVYKPPQTSCVSNATPNAPVFDQSFFVCVAEPAPGDPSCGTCIPTSSAPFSGVQCVLNSGANSDDICPAGYPVRHELGTAADIQDNRTCTGCSCGTPTGGTCSSGSMAACTGKACSGCGPGVPTGICAPGQSASVNSPPPTTGMTCSGGGIAVSTGTLSLAQFQLLCCTE